MTALVIMIVIGLVAFAMTGEPEALWFGVAVVVFGGMAASVAIAVTWFAISVL